MKVIGKTVSGKTTFVAAFTEILIKYTPIESNLISLTGDQKGWDRIRNHIIIPESIESIKEINNALLICDDTQIQLKNNKTLTELILNKRHKKQINKKRRIIHTTYRPVSKNEC